jgi:hypothetical protein
VAMYQDFHALNPDKDRDLVSLFDVARFCYAKDKISWKQGQKKKRLELSLSFFFLVLKLSLFCCFIYASRV